MTSSAATVGHYARQSMQTLTALVPASACAFYRIDDWQQPQDYFLQQMPARVHAHYLAHYQQHDPLLPRRWGRAVTVVALQEILSRTALQQSVYGRFMQRHGMVDVVEIFIQRAGRPVAGFSLIRDASLGLFAAHELHTLRQLHGLLTLAASSHLPAPAVPDTLALTPRERDVVQLLRDGACNKTIARTLDVSVPTIKTHLQHLYRKLGVCNRTELVCRLFQGGVAHPPPH